MDGELKKRRKEVNISDEGMKPWWSPVGFGFGPVLLISIWARSANFGPGSNAKRFFFYSTKFETLKRRERPFCT